MESVAAAAAFDVVSLDDICPNDALAAESAATGI